jgi:hypothetical protein
MTHDEDPAPVICSVEVAAECCGVEMLFDAVKLGAMESQVCPECERRVTVSLDGLIQREKRNPAWANGDDV